MQFDWVTFGFQIVNVLVLLAILRRFLFRPVADMVARRQADITAAQDAADAARARAAELQADGRAAVQGATDARADLLAAAQAEATRQGAGLIADARVRADAIVQEARKDAARVIVDAQGDTLRRARDLAETIAARALSALPAPPTAEGFAHRLAQELAAMPGDRRGAMLGGADLRLIAPARPAPGELAPLEPLGLDRAPIDLDPALIAGLDLLSAAGRVRNSLAHDLDRISEALRDDDRSGA